MHDLGGQSLLVGRLPERLMPNATEFEALWNERPKHRQKIKMAGAWVTLPRGQQAYGVDYHFSSQVNEAIPFPAALEQFILWSQQNIYPAGHGLLLNWYENGNEYIGRHRDSRGNLVPGSPIVTISLGAERTFRLRPWPPRLKGKPINFRARNGTVFVLPWKTNLAFSHEVTRSSRCVGRRISITVRAFVI